MWTTQAQVHSRDLLSRGRAAGADAAAGVRQGTGDVSEHHVSEDRVGVSDDVQAARVAGRCEQGCEGDVLAQDEHPGSRVPEWAGGVASAPSGAADDLVEGTGADEQHAVAGVLLSSEGEAEQFRYHAEDRAVRAVHVPGTVDERVSTEATAPLREWSESV